MDYTPLKREELIDVIEGKKSARRVPMMIHFWTRDVFKDEDKILSDKLLEEYPNDIEAIGLNMPAVNVPPEDDNNYRFVNIDFTEEELNRPIDDRVALKDWDDLEEVIENFPDFNYKNLIPKSEEKGEKYRLCYFWFFYFERLWKLRGMTNSFMDFYENEEYIHRLFRKLTDFYKGVIKRVKNELDADGIFVSDDMGSQTSTLFSADFFREFFKPYYKEIVEELHKNNMHFWLHSCGNIENIIDDLIEIGVDVLHPIQKYTMEEKKIAEKYGDKICIWAGFDVQQKIPYASADEVRQEVRFMMDTYYRKDGRFMITLGNGITEDCKVESLKALLDECLRYGSEM